MATGDKKPYDHREINALIERGMGTEVHKWDYERPICLWERLPFWIRWPMAAALVVYFGGGLIAFFIAVMMRN